MTCIELPEYFSWNNTSEAGGGAKSGHFHFVSGAVYLLYTCDLEVFAMLLATNVVTC